MDDFKKFVEERINEIAPDMPEEMRKQTRAACSALLEADYNELATAAPDDLNKEKIQGMIDSVMDSMPKTFSDKEKKLHREVLEKVFLKGEPLNEAVGISDEMMELIYAFGFNMYQSGNLKDAIGVMNLLCILCPESVRYQFALAAAYHMHKDYEEAIKRYLCCSFVDKLSPVPFFHAADCYMKMKDDSGAFLMLTLVLERCGKEKMYHTIREKSEMMLKAIKERMEKVK
ncbi:MAG: SycD/LcrH family type III secretion system chaperone [Chlamydiales bacterium]|nr:SycD/LcrH family type III secretion system chaperone [Chlamydiia bacterium]MCP5507004.1 SycD/LcrH family type III secretion system chaperone [Chlamydiales bacterium]